MITTEKRAELKAQGEKANTILAQLGGNRMVAMTGAKNFLATPTGLRFNLPRNLAKSGINMVSVDLNDADLYDVRFIKFNANTLDCKAVSIVENIDATRLRETFSEATGLSVSL